MHAYICLATAALYTHLYSGFVLLALNLAFLLWWIVSPGPHKRKCIILWIAAQIIVLLVLCVWMPFIIAQFDGNATYWHGAVYWKEIVAQTLTAFSVGKSLQGVWAKGAVWSLSILAILGTLTLCWHKRDRLAAILLWLWLLVPTLVLIALTFNRPKFSPRYLMNALPAFLLLGIIGHPVVCALGTETSFYPRKLGNLGGIVAANNHRNRSNVSIFAQSLSGRGDLSPRYAFCCQLYRVASHRSRLDRSCGRIYTPRIYLLL